MTNGMRERTRAGLDSELAEWVAGAQLIRLVGLEELYG